MPAHVYYRLKVNVLVNIIGFIINVPLTRHKTKVTGENVIVVCDGKVAIIRPFDV
jgi:hypothetical protein